MVRQFRCSAILFDLDGVLVISAESVRRSWQTWAEANGLSVEAVEAATHGRRTIDTIRYLAPALDAATVAADLEAAQARDVAGIGAGPGAADLLAALRRDEWAVVTSGSRVLARSRLRAATLPEPPVLVSGDEVAAGKPDPEGYLRAAAIMGLDPARCLVVEDAPAGVAAARAAGMPVVGLSDDPSGLSGADALATSCAQLRVLRSAHGCGLELHVLDKF